mmetsp:Transcript_23032/g.56787  ORF Transcript_23032/g.56787 Transcript_23032/m.56787 type:complete len:85 (+) Transcript_23032:101-355(+)
MPLAKQPDGKSALVCFESTQEGCTLADIILTPPTNKNPIHNHYCCYTDQVRRFFLRVSARYFWTSLASCFARSSASWEYLAVDR